MLKVSIAVSWSMSRNSDNPKDVPDSLTARIPIGSSLPLPIINTDWATSSSISKPRSLSNLSDNVTLSSEILVL